MASLKSQKFLSFLGQSLMTYEEIHNSVVSNEHWLTTLVDIATEEISKLKLRRIWHKVQKISHLRQDKQ